MQWKIDWNSEASDEANIPRFPEVENYQFVFDEAKNKIYFLYSPEYHCFGSSFEWVDKKGWKKNSDAHIRIGSAACLWKAIYYPPNNQTLIFNIDREDGLIAAALTDDDYTKQNMSGSLPDVEELADSYDTPSLPLGYDKKRQTLIFFNDHAIWEMNEKFEWTKVLNRKPFFSEFDGEEQQGVNWLQSEEKCLLWRYAENEFEDKESVLIAYLWDGEHLEPVEQGDLPEDLVGTFNDSTFAICEFEETIALFSGKSQVLYHIENKTWVKNTTYKRTPSNRPACGHMIYNKYHFRGFMFGPFAGDEDQYVFTNMSRITSKDIGELKNKSILNNVKNSNSSWVFNFVNNRNDTLAVGRWKSLITQKFDEDKKAWTEIVSDEQGEELFALADPDLDGKFERVVSADKCIYGISSLGAVYQFENNCWTVAAKIDPTFGERSSFSAAFDESTQSLVVWGGKVNDKNVNETLSLSNGKWIKEKSKIRRPSGFNEHDLDSYTMRYDPVDQCCILFGTMGVYYLIDGEWIEKTPNHYCEYLPVNEYRWVIQDPDTDQILLIPAPHRSNPHQVFLYTSEEIIDMGEINRTEKVSNFIDRFYRHDNFPFTIECLYSSKSKNIYMFDVEFDENVVHCDLSETFSYAQANHERRPQQLIQSEDKQVDGAEFPVYLYKVEDDEFRLFTMDYKSQEGSLNFGEGTIEEYENNHFHSSFKIVHSAEQANKLAKEMLTEHIAEDWKSAEELTDGDLKSLTKREYRQFSLGESITSPTTNTFWGGLPIGIEESDWPEDDDDNPMGFLFQMEFPEGYLGDGTVMAVFHSISGGDLSEPEFEIIFVDEDNIGKSFITTAPEGVKPLPTLALKISDQEYWAIGENSVNLLLTEDPYFETKVENFNQQFSSPEDSNPLGQIGGAPTLLQEAPLQRERLILQIDFDYLDVDFSSIWPDAGFMGMMYITGDEDGDFLEVEWQYT